MYASTLPRSNWLRRASIRLAWYRHMPASSIELCCLVVFDLSCNVLFPYLFFVLFVFLLLLPLMANEVVWLILTVVRNNIIDWVTHVSGFFNFKCGQFLGWSCQHTCSAKLQVTVYLLISNLYKRLVFLGHHSFIKLSLLSNRDFGDAQKTWRIRETRVGNGNVPVFCFIPLKKCQISFCYPLPTVLWYRLVTSTNYTYTLLNQRSHWTVISKVQAEQVVC